MVALKIKVSPWNYWLNLNFMVNCGYENDASNMDMANNLTRSFIINDLSRKLNDKSVFFM